LVGNVALPAIHGGVVGAFLELTALIGLLDQTDSERVPRPINFTVDFLRSVGPRETRARAEIVKDGRRIAKVRVIAWQDDPAKPVAAGVGNLLV
jgi:acyl-coenzyme A thioesterase PaaI-like protein